AIVSGLGAVGGVALAIGIVVLIRSLLPPGVSLPISTVSVLLALAASAGVGLTFGYLPARRAANLLTVAALRHELQVGRRSDRSRVRSGPRGGSSPDDSDASSGGFTSDAERYSNRR